MNNQVKYLYDRMVDNYTEFCIYKIKWLILQFDYVKIYLSKKVGGD